MVADPANADCNLLCFLVLLASCRHTAAASQEKGGAGLVKLRTWAYAAKRKCGLVLPITEIGGVDSAIARAACAPHSSRAQREERLRLWRKGHEGTWGLVAFQEHVLFSDASAAASLNERRVR